jgi:hypothetical protein
MQTNKKTCIFNLISENSFNVPYGKFQVGHVHQSKLSKVDVGD